MGSNDGAETCKIVGLFLLHSSGEKFNKDGIGLYRDDGLAYFKNNNGHQDLDITFDLNTGSYRPYRKQNNDARYINVKSNHPPSILEQIPAAISKRISTNSSNKQIFQYAAPHYNNIIKNKGYREKISNNTNINKATNEKSI